MRVLALALLFTGMFYYFAPSKDANEIDILKVKVSAPERTHEPEITSSIPEEVIPEESEPVVESETYGEPAQGLVYDDSLETEVAEVEHYEDDGEAQQDELEAGWNYELRESLSILEPEMAEDMYNAYEAERSAYQADFDFLIKKHQKNADLEFMLNDLELRHEERLKEIFGRHYEEIKALQSSYLEYRTSSN